MSHSANDFKTAAWQLLKADVDLVQQLAENNNPYDPLATTSKVESIVDYLQGGKMVAPFITLRADNETLVGRTHLTNAFLLVRCYNEKDKSFYTINELVSRVKHLLDGQRFTLEGTPNVETVWETTSAELPDDGYDLNYRELTFRIQLT